MERLALVVTIFLAIVLRLNVIHRGLWLDEAWVANSVVAPSLSAMFYYDRWVQTTPPLLLILVRAVTSCFGVSEVSLRAVPWLAGVLSVLVMVVALRRIFSWSLALIGITFFSANYYASKYSQQVKQYSTDLLVSCLFLLLLWLFLESNRGQRVYWVLVALGTGGVFLSYTVVFWFPSVIAAAVLKSSRLSKGAEDAGLWSDEGPRTKILVSMALYAAGLAAVYFYFIYPNRAPNLLAQWRGDFLGSGGLLFSSLGLARNFCQFLFPRHPWWLLAFSYLAGGLCGLGLLRAVIQSTHAGSRGRLILVLTALPMAAAAGASLVRQYPLLTYPRFLLWMLPMCCVLLLYCLELLWAQVTQFFPISRGRLASDVLVSILCVIFLLGNYFYLKVNPTRPEEVREAVLYLKEHAASGDPLFITGAHTEQFFFYSRFLRWSPASLYVANVWWPCCSRNKTARVANPTARNIREDLHTFVLRTGNGDVWLLLPHGSPGDWEYGLWEEVEKVPKLMALEGCREFQRSQFLDALVYAFACSVGQSATGN